MNQLETDWLQVLKIRMPNVNWRYEDIKLKLRGGSTYLPDFVGLVNGVVMIYECKGQHRFREKGIYKLRLAAEQYPEFLFTLVQRQTDGWKETVYGRNETS